MAHACIERGVVICSDEIHCDIILDGRKHIPTASLSPEIAQHTITLMAPSKTFNIPGLGFSFAIIQNPELLQYKKVMGGMVPHAGIFGYVGALAAYERGQEWLEQSLVHYAGNRDFAVNFVKTHMPQLHITNPESTYLSWVDCSRAGIGRQSRKNTSRNSVSPSVMGVTLVPMYGDFVRITMACPRSLLADGLEMMRKALEPLS
jgi:cystathionine beta-lyase